MALSLTKAFELIVLGNAWESVDVLLASSLRTTETSKVGYLACLRYQELIDQGGKSFAFPGQTGEALKARLEAISIYRNSAGSDGSKLEVTPAYRELRDEAETWHKRRTAYMMIRLKAGRHPDTDPTFWNEYHDAGSPSLRLPWLQLIQHQLNDPYVALMIWIPGLCLGAIMLTRLFRRVLRRRRVVWWLRQS